jgi:hypothetical protein
MIVECGHCGAPLDVREGRHYTKCTYCKKTSEARALRTIEQQTPPGWRPPPVWTPPAHVPANSAVPLRLHSSSGAAGLVVAMVFVSLIIAGGVMAAVLARPNVINKKGKTAGTPAYPGGPKRIDPSALAKVSMKSTPERLQETTGVAMDAQHSMRVPLAHPNWEAVTFRWDPDHLDHVKDFYLNGVSDNPTTEPRKTLKAVVGRRFEKDGFQWEGCGLNADAKGGYVGSHVTIDSHGKEDAENPYWRQQSETMWKLTRHAALGVGDPPKKSEVRDYLGGGYPLGDLAKLNVDADIDGSDAAIKKVFPGGVRSLFIDLDYKVPIEHPWYGDMEIGWKNKKGAKLADVSIRPPVGSNGKWPNQKAIDGCVEAAFGKPSRVSEGDHLGGSRDTTWNPASGGAIRVYEHMLVITLRDSPFSKPMPKDVWLKTVAALDQCGRKAE